MSIKTVFKTDVTPESLKQESIDKINSLFKVLEDDFNNTNSYIEVSQAIDGSNVDYDIVTDHVWLSDKFKEIVDAQ